ncbi:hypothetical protein Celal_0796 [Cellulophaga algicola DSM 14237]|uniref:Peptidase M56 domain-containing protein n=1 Tax=Cellulophaga algicola (strain DSM 14237 / IC166 / ACAM 630) TaxID=688270 RepID=E6XES8_CELAD|nr:hypothetical protein [Cellulophaga sp. E16_2]ADV48130.1 hypothetical protein Celal_0796 [Cellulophaga algicola DSM 14237]
MILVSKLFFVKNYVGLTLWPFIIVKDDALKDDIVLINHEKIHLKQQIELLVVFFYIFYLLEWAIRCICYLNSYKAYKNISFEREAYANEKNLNYPKARSAFSFIKYL